jgi:hypothetical protein
MTTFETGRRAKREGSALDDISDSSLRCVISERKKREIHPLLAPLAWIGCFILGAAFWIIVIRFALSL